MDTSKINLVIDVIDNALNDDTMLWYPLFSWAEKKTGVSRFRLLLVILCVISLNILFKVGLIFISNTVSFVYPAYQTIKILETQWPLWTFSNIQSIQWLMYWMIYSVIMILEQSLKFILVLVPFYQLIKAVFLVWCFLPIKNNGSIFIYSVYLIRSHDYD
ncbi:receptor expression-enhancing protein 5-like [Sipha flava]|uniref:Receptor expression-enhancing protein n=1 Tax=Sipha flava TaxID=143950 RepID=A0A8B8G6M2_9HEMI|nr:receptor expression-enhancing protein 5-like [Sipha flava]